MRIVSNNSQLGFRGMHEKLLRLGLPVDAHELILATQVLARRLAETSPRATVYAARQRRFAPRDLQDEGLRVIQTPEEIDYLCDYLVVGTDWEINYQRLRGPCGSCCAGRVTPRSTGTRCSLPTTAPPPAQAPSSAPLRA